MTAYGEPDPHLDTARELFVRQCREHVARLRLAVLVWEPRPTPRRFR